jgi:mono/diheme cytochrome c family protein
MFKLSVTLLAGAFLFIVSPITTHGQQPAQLPEGDGKQLVQGLCVACHETNLITRSSGYTREGWRELVQTMINLSGNQAEETISKYLATHFPPGTELKPNWCPARRQ